MDIEIPFSKAKIIVRILISFVLIVLFILLWVIQYTQRREMPLQIQIISIVGIIPLCFFVRFNLLRYRDKSPGLIINDKGIQNNSGVSSNKLIPWKNITGVKTKKIKGSKIFLILINNADEIIENEGNRWKQLMMEWSNRVHGTPISITSGTLDCSFDDLVKVVSDCYNAQQVNKVKGKN